MQVVVVTEEAKRASSQNPFRSVSVSPFLSFVTYPPHSLPSCNNIYAPVVGQSAQAPFAFTCCVIVKIPPKYLGSLTKWQPTKSYLQHPDRCPQLLLSSNDGQSTGQAQPGWPQLWALLPFPLLPSLLPYPCSFRSFVATRGRPCGHHCSHRHAARKHKGRRKKTPWGRRRGIMAFLHLRDALRRICNHGM